ncbi:Membrane protein insertase YidC [Candidatus Cyrtobacter comes]|uniref:Membrane protein insertase YidC n=1 Tax=Candidatus Cyrtobacter comes TaxID=675776 RepID=A0ABU5L7J7_9RICK|nr:membrane protein insertase YidC [Candidatus Cyrtobacter comes]MDZ5762098.1 Membrane protein insertase YidC [Candidatus Cyrtobacter comes]
MSDQIRIAIAVLLSAIVLFLSQYFFAPQHNSKHEKVMHDEIGDEEVRVEKIVSRDDVMLSSDRVNFENKLVKGSINLTGALLDDLVLKNFNELDGSQLVLLSPSNTSKEYFVEFGWVSEKGIELPSLNTKWNILDNSVDHVNLWWENNVGIRFEIKVSLDDKYLLNIIQRVVNLSDKNFTIRSRSIIKRVDAGAESSSIMHEGAIGSINSTLKEVDFGNLKDGEKFTYKDSSGWVGFSDKYWLVSLFAENSSTKISGVFSNDADGRYRVSYLLPAQTMVSDDSSVTNFNLFVGPKQLDVLDYYQEKFNVSLFDRAVDFGFLYFITKPIFLFLHEVYLFTGNFGLAILILTVLIKVLLLPLSYKSFIGMNKMKKFQPQIQKIKEKYENNPMELQKATIEFYKKNNVNPLSGCLPILLQMPVFFALYKVLYVTIEMRHAPFYFWITDLSARDPTSIFNLFGLIPWSPPEFLKIGILPILMSLSMYIQQQMNPAPTDPIQAKIMKFLPVFFLVMFSSFPSGLVLYWLWSNILSVLQQFLIKRCIPSEK